MAEAAYVQNLGFSRGLCARMEARRVHAVWHREGGVSRSSRLARRLAPILFAHGPHAIEGAQPLVLELLPALEFPPRFRGPLRLRKLLVETERQIMLHEYGGYSRRRIAELRHVRVLDLHHVRLPCP